MQAFFQYAIEHQSEKTILVGTDSPTLPIEIVHKAFQILEHTDCVLGPALDGGYYLVGCCDTPPPIFQNIDWSSDQVLSQTCAALESAGVSYDLLPPWIDIDTIDDLNSIQTTTTNLPVAMPTHRCVKDGVSGVSGLSATNSDSIVIIGGGVIGLSIAYELHVVANRFTWSNGTEFGKEASWAARHSTTANPETALDPLEKLRELAISYTLSGPNGYKVRQELTPNFDAVEDSIWLANKAKPHPWQGI